MKTRRGVATPVAQHWYEANARRYDRLHPGLSGDVEFYAELGRGRHVLEIGAGTGRVTAAMAATAGSIVALDNAPEMLRIAARQLVGAGSSLAVLCADARALPLSASFDLAVLAYRTVQHLDPGDRRMMFQA